LVLIALAAIAPIQSAYAYVDPNSAGPLYQLLFPLLVALASAFAALRRYIAQLWNRLVRRCTAMMRRALLTVDSKRDS
jgi:hypothetical protein